jgi:hypothetical protein
LKSRPWLGTGIMEVGTVTFMFGTGIMEVGTVTFMFGRVDHYCLNFKKFFFLFFLPLSNMNNQNFRFSVRY